MNVLKYSWIYCFLYLPLIAININKLINSQFTIMLEERSNLEELKFRLRDIDLGKLKQYFQSSLQYYLKLLFFQ